MVFGAARKGYHVITLRDLGVMSCCCCVWAILVLQQRFRRLCSLKVAVYQLNSLGHVTPMVIVLRVGPRSLPFRYGFGTGSLDLFWSFLSS